MRRRERAGRHDRWPLPPSFGACSLIGADTRSHPGDTNSGHRRNSPGADHSKLAAHSRRAVLGGRLALADSTSRAAHSKAAAVARSTPGAGHSKAAAVARSTPGAAHNKAAAVERSTPAVHIRVDHPRTRAVDKVLQVLPPTVRLRR